MQWSEIQFNADRKLLRQFAGLWLIFFGGLACWEGLARGNTTTAGLLAAAALTVGLLGLAYPRLVRPIYVAWMVLAFPIGWTVSQIILGVLFYGVFTPVSLVFRLIGRDALARSRRPDRDTYWTPKPGPHGVRGYFHQY